MIWPTRLRSRPASAAASQTRAPPPRTDRKGSMGESQPRADRPRDRLLVMGHGGPQAIAGQYLDVMLHRFPGSGGDNRLALVMHVQHQLGRFFLRVTEDVLKHVSHVRHEVDRVVP